MADVCGSFVWAATVAAASRKRKNMKMVFDGVKRFIKLPLRSKNELVSAASCLVYTPVRSFDRNFERQ